jgi:acyl dehydratase
VAEAHSASGPVPGVIVGEPVGPFDACLDKDLLLRYAAATKDPSPRVRAGVAMPLGAVVLAIWEAQNAGRAAAVPQALQWSGTGGVHGEHEFLLHRPIVPGEPLRVWAAGHGSRPAGRNSLATLHYQIRDAADQLVAEQWWTTVYLNTTCEVTGSPPPEHLFPADARARPVGVWNVDVDAEMANRYAEVSGDWSAHHFDLDAARQSGFDRTFLHGLCTMGLCAQGVVELVAGGDPDRVRRIAVRFATPTFLGEQLHVRLYDAGPLGYAFEADSAGASVITHGRAELR